MKNDEMSPTYKTMPGSSCPFSPEGLTVYEIEAFYREAKDKNEAVNILADCCATYPANMARFLSERGLISGINPSAFKGETERERKYREKVAKVLELAEKGFTSREAAEILGLPYKSVRTLASRNKITFFGNTKKARQQKGETEMEKKNTGLTPEREDKAWLQEIDVRCKALAVENKELADQLENLRACYRETAENYEKVNAVAQDQAEKIRFLEKKLEDSELARDRLEGQMEVVRMFLSNNRNS